MYFSTLTKLSLVLLAVTLTLGQDPTTQPPLDGEAYGAVCNGLLRQCHRYSETVLCMSRAANETVGTEVCSTGINVDIGRCQCRRNCGADGKYIADGEFDEARQKCVGFNGKSCAINPDCTANARCNLVSRICECQNGFKPSSDGLHCIPA